MSSTESLAATAAPPTAGAAEKADRLAFILISALALLAALAVRIAAARDEFWLDEIWSLDNTVGLDSPLGVFRLHHDNNHFLISIWMYLVGERPQWLIYRVPSLIAGMGTIVLAGWIARQWGRAETLFALGLFGASYMLVVYASEARGYALAGFFALAAFAVLQRYLRAPTIWLLGCYWLLVILGFLSHLTFLHFCVGAGVWSLVAIGRETMRWGDKLAHMALINVFPGAMAVALFFGHVRQMDFGGGDTEYSLPKVVLQTVAIALRGDNGHMASDVFSVVVVLASTIYALVALARSRSNLWAFFAVAIFLSPALVMLIKRPWILYPRYFYINVVFLLLLFSYFLGRLWRLATPGRVVVVAFLGVVLIGNVRKDKEFLALGRGHYRQALKYIVDHTVSDTLVINADMPMRVGLTFDYYRGLVRPPKRIDFHFELEPPKLPPEWFVFHSQLAEFSPQPRWKFLGADYRLEFSARSSELSGFHCAVFHRMDIQGPPPPIR